MTKIGRALVVLALLVSASCASRRAEGHGTPAESDALVLTDETTGARYVAGEVVVRLADGAEAPSRAGPYHCSVAAHGGGHVVLLRCTDDAGRLAPLEPLREALEAHPSVLGTEPHWIRSHR
jgi:hypothetical protein